MRILAMLTDAFASPGGIAQYNRDLMAALARSPLVSEIVAIARSGTADPHPAPKVHQLAPAAGRLAWSARAARAVRHHRPDVVFCGHVNAAPLAALLARSNGRRLWVQAHGIEAWSDRGRAIRHAIANARLVTAVSRHTRRRLLQWCDVRPERVRVLSNTFDPAFEPRFLRRDLVSRYGLYGRRVILTVGRIAASEAYKGHDRILHCLPAVAAAVPEVSYLVVGAGDDAARLDDLARALGVRDRLILAGAVPPEELPDTYALADVFAMPSTGEGFGIVFLEAAAAGLPVIGSNRDGSLDALADGALGRAVDPDDPGALTDALVAALQGRVAAGTDAVRRFAFDNFAAHVDALVRDLGR